MTYILFRQSSLHTRVTNKNSISEGIDPPLFRYI